MGIYFCLIGFTLLAYLYTSNLVDGSIAKSRRQLNILWSYILLLVCIALQGLRAESVGGDLYDNYVRIFYECGCLSWYSILHFESTYEIGYVILNKLIYSSFGSGEFGLRALLLIIAILYHMSLFKLLRWYSKNTIYSLFLFFCFGLFNISMNNLRSTMALVFVYFAIGYALENKTLKTILFMLVASFFHLTALSFLIFVFSLLVNRKTCLLVYFGGIAVFFIFGYGFFRMIIENHFPKYIVYLSASKGGYHYFLFLIAILAWMLLVPKKGYYENRERMVLLKIFCCGVVLQLISIRAAFFVRTVYYHLIGAVLLLPGINEHAKIKKGMGQITLLVCVMFIVFYTYTIMIRNETRTVPYMFFWQNYNY